MNKIRASILLLLILASCERNRTVKTVYIEEVKDISADSIIGEWTLTSLRNIEQDLNLKDESIDSIKLNLLANSKYNLKTLDSTELIFAIEGNWSLTKTKKGMTILLEGLNQKDHIVMDSSFNLFKSEKGLLMLSQMDKTKASTSFTKSD